jgi:hypothetical protein
LQFQDYFYVSGSQSKIQVKGEVLLNYIGIIPALIPCLLPEPYMVQEKEFSL